jgi:hypothetical protein
VHVTVFLLQKHSHVHRGTPETVPWRRFHPILVVTSRFSGILPPGLLCTVA